MWKLSVSKMSLWLWLLLLLQLVNSSCGIMLELEPRKTRCLMEAVVGGELITGNFNITELPGLAVGYMVREMPSGSLLARGRPSSGGGGSSRFTVTLEEDQIIEVCFESFTSNDDSHLLDRKQVQGGGLSHVVSLMMKSESGNLTEAMRASLEALEPMERLLKSCELLASSALVDFEKMRAKEAKMTDTNHSTKNKLFYITMFSVAVLTSVSAWQLIYLHRYFKSRRLI